jgi:DNA-binding CsgD family transcriptional regulator
MQIDHIEHEEMRERIYRPYLVRERVVVSARAPKSAVAISLMRTERNGPFSPDGLAALEAASEGIVALAMKHVALTKSAAEARSALTSLPTIEACLACATPALARREAEVCSRILYGMTSMGIALALGISEESAMTYRKRAYGRLEIGSQRELLLWYLDQWSQHRFESAVEDLCAA